MGDNDQNIGRMLRKEGDNENEINSENVLKNMYRKVFGQGAGESAGVISISTTYNDYKKFHDDMKFIADQWSEKIICISQRSNIEDLLELNVLRKYCKKKYNNIIENNSQTGIRGAFAVVLTLIEIIQALYTFIKGQILGGNTGLFISMILLLLIVAIVATLISQRKKQNDKLIESLNSWEEKNIIRFFEKVGMCKPKINSEGIYFVENLSKINKLCRCYISVYLSKIDYIRQLWCVFDYQFENTTKVESVSNKAYFEKYRLLPLTFEKKEKLYNEYNLQRDICKEYLNCIGVDILLPDIYDDTDSTYKYHSLSYVENKLLEVESNFNGDNKNGSILMNCFYCFVYISAMYRYSFSIKQMVHMMQDMETVDKDLKKIITKVSKKIKGEYDFKNSVVENFLEKIIDILEGYYFVEKVNIDGEMIKKYKFAYDVLECLQKKFQEKLPTRQNVRKWVLVKMISNRDFFYQERYFFDCCNILIQSDFDIDKDYLLITSDLLKLLNKHNCWFYYSPILRQIYTLEMVDKNKYLDQTVLKAAAINNLLYHSDDESIEMAIGFLGARKEKSIIPYSFWDGKFMRNKHLPDIMMLYFSLPYMVMVNTVYCYLRLGFKYERTFAPLFSEEQKEITLLFEIFNSLIQIGIICFSDIKRTNYIYDYVKEIRRYLKKLKGCEEVKTFTFIIDEILSWIESEVYGKPNRNWIKSNVEILIDTGNSCMLNFLYIF